MRNDAFIPALQYGQSTNIQPQFDAVVIPAFSYTHAYTVATIIADYPMENATAVSIRLPLPDEITAPESFGLCVRYTESGTTIRYVLYKPTWFDGILFPQYTGEKLGADATLEVWALDDINPAYMDEDATIYTGPLNFFTPNMYNVFGQLSGTTTTLTPTVL